MCQVCTRPTIRPYSDEDAPTCGQREILFCPNCEEEVEFHYYDRLSSAAMLARIVAKQSICEEKKAAGGAARTAPPHFPHHRQTNPTATHAIPATTNMVTRALVEEKERNLSSLPSSSSAQAIPATTSMVTRALLEEKERGLHTDAIPATTSMVTRALVEEKERNLRNLFADDTPPSGSPTARSHLRLQPRDSNNVESLEFLLSDPTRLDTNQLTSLKAFLTSSLFTVDTLISERSMCLICLERPRVAVALPCRHRCMCEGCLANMEQRLASGSETTGNKLKCPMCRAPVDQFILPFDN